MKTPETSGRGSWFVGRPLVGSSSTVDRLRAVIAGNPPSGIKTVAFTTDEAQPRQVLAIPLMHRMALSGHPDGRSVAVRLAADMRRVTGGRRLPGTLDGAVLVTGDRMNPTKVRLAVGGAAVTTALVDEQIALAAHLESMDTLTDTTIDYDPGLTVAEVPARLPALGMMALRGVMENAAALQRGAVLAAPEALFYALEK